MININTQKGITTFSEFFNQYKILLMGLTRDSVKNKHQIPISQKISLRNELKTYEAAIKLVLKSIDKKYND